MDNFYNSLAHILVTKKTDVYGTLKLSSKEVPPELKKGELSVFQRQSLCPALHFKTK